MAPLTGTAAAPPAGSAGAWLLAARLRTLPVAVSPVLVGWALAAADGAFVAAPALGALTGALLLQLAANFANDAFDHERGADGPDRLGPPRAAQLGLLTPRALKRGAGLSLAAAACVGLALVSRGGWPILWIGIASMAAALGYVGGPAYGYRGLGDAAVFLFFGLTAVCGTYWVQALALPASVWLAAIPVGCWATAVLVVNNVRDLEGDRRAGKRTLAVCIGPGAARAEYALLLLAAYACLPLLAAWRDQPLAAWLPACTLPLALLLVRDVARGRGAALDATLAGTARAGLVFALLLAVGLAA